MFYRELDNFAGFYTLLAGLSWLNKTGGGDIADDFQFLSCCNVGSGLGAICASLPRSCEKLEVNAPFSCSLVLLHRGIHFCEKSQELFHLFYKWNDNIIPYASVTQFMKAHNCVRSFVTASFSCQLSKSSVIVRLLRGVAAVVGVD